MALKVALKVPPALLSASCAGRGLFGLLSNLLSVADQLPSAQPDFARFAFHCRSAAVEVGVRALQGGSLTAAEQASAESFLGDALMPRVEADCSALQIRKSDEKSELQRLQTFALSLFTGAEKEHVLGAWPRGRVPPSAPCAATVSPLPGPAFSLVRLSFRRRSQ